MYKGLVRRFNGPERDGPTLLVVGAHPDDAELEAGLASLVYKDLGYRVVHTALSTGEVRAGNRLDELAEAQEILGTNESFVFGYPDGHLGDSAYRNDILSDLSRLREEQDPEIVIFHSSKDRHQDHRSVHELASIAFRDGPTKFEMEAPSTERALFEPRVYVRTKDLGVALTAAHALRSFVSQRDIVDPFAALAQFVAAGRECMTKPRTEPHTNIEGIVEDDPLGLPARDYETIARMYPQGTVFAQRFEPNGIYVG